MDNPDVRLLSVENEALLTCSFNLLKNMCERSWRQLQPIEGKEVMIRMYRGTLVSGSVNISVYFNKLANNFLTIRQILKKKLRIEINRPFL